MAPLISRQCGALVAIFPVSLGWGQMRYLPGLRPYSIVPGLNPVPSGYQTFSPFIQMLDYRMKFSFVFKKHLGKGGV